MIALITSSLIDSGSINWGDIATWVTGVATIALFIVAFIQIQTERNLRTEREKRNQAEHLSSWIIGEGINNNDYVAWVKILNQSSQPVYQVIVSIVAVPETGRGMYRGGPIASDQTYIDVVPPGHGYTMVPAHYQGMFRRPGVELAFQDGTRRSWVRSAVGILSEIKETTAEHYHVGLPAHWQSLYAELPPEEEMYQMPNEEPDSPTEETTS